MIYDNNLQAIMRSDKQLFLEKLCIDYSWIHDINFINDFKLLGIDYRDEICDSLLSKKQSETVDYNDKEIQWLINNGSPSVLNRLINSYYSFWLKCDQFIQFLSSYDIENKIMNEEMEWIFKRGKKRVDFFSNDSKPHRNKVFLRATISLFLFDVWKRKKSYTIDFIVLWLIKFGTDTIFDELVKTNHSNWLGSVEFVQEVKKYRKNNLSASNFIFDFWNSFDKKQYDDNIIWLLENAEESVIVKIININKNYWLNSTPFISQMKSLYLTALSEDFVYEVWRYNNLSDDESIQYLLENGSIKILKKALQIKLNCTYETMEKFYQALYPDNDSNYYHRVANSKNWDSVFANQYILNSQDRIKRKLKGFIEDSLKVKKEKRVCLPKSIYSATDLSRFAFCPASYIINETYNIDISKQEKISVGIKEHNNQRLINYLSYEKENVNYVLKNILHKLDNNFYKRILQSECIFQGHNNNQMILQGKDSKILGIPDYIFEDDKGQFVVEEKFTFEDPSTIVYPYFNHKIQALAYLYAGFEDFNIKEAYVIYWFVKKIENHYSVYHSKSFKIIRTAENSAILEEILASVELLNIGKAYTFYSEKINYNKCTKCSYFPYCEYKFGTTKVDLTLPI